MADRSRPRRSAWWWERRHDRADSRGPRGPTSRPTCSPRRPAPRYAPAGRGRDGAHPGRDRHLATMSASRTRARSRRCRSSAATAPAAAGRRPGPPRARPASSCPPAARSPSSRADSSSTARRPAARRARCWRCCAPSILPLRAAAAGEGITLLAAGIDPSKPDRARRRCCSGPAVRADGGVPGAPRARAARA